MVKKTINAWLTEVKAAQSGDAASSAEIHKGPSLVLIERQVHEDMFRFGFISLAGLLLFYAAFHLYRSLHTALVNDMWLGLGLVLALVLQQIGKPLRALDVLNGSFFITLTLQGLTQGGDVNTPAYWWMSVIPFVTAQTGNFWLALIELVIAVVYGMLSTWLTSRGVWVPPTPERISIEHVMLAITLSALYYLGYLYQAMKWRRRALAQFSAAVLEANAAGKAKADFLANMSHEIRTPMNAILGFSHVLAKSALEPKQRENVQHIQQASEHLLGVVNDILDYSKIEAGKLVLERAPFDLRLLLDRAESMQRERVQTKGLALRIELAPDVPTRLVGDALRLSQVLINLLSNAIKFTSRGHVTLRVELVRRMGEAVELRFTVQDTGIGMTPQQQAKLFQGFEQADVSITRQFGGTGLGLVICKRLVALMGGAIGVKSQADKGSAFSFNARFELDTSKVTPSWSFEGLRALVVDDNSKDRNELIQLLQGWSVQVDAAASGLAAIQALQRAAAYAQPYDLVLLDWQMPGADGLDTANGIAALGLERPPQIIMVTAYASDDLIQQAKRAAVFAVLSKPLSPNVLGNAIKSCLHPLTGRVPAELATARARWQGVRILLAEDNPLNQILLQELLADTGVHLDIANNGREAIQMAATGQYDLVLMDMQMPEMDGLEATRQIRQQPRLTQIPIVALTANVVGDVKLQCQAAGMNDFVSKPVEPAVLYAAIERWLGRGSSAPSQGLAPAGRDAIPATTSSTAPPSRAWESRAAAPARPPGFPDHIPGLEMEAALARMLGRAERYLDILQGYVKDHASAADAIAAALKAGDNTTAERLAHTGKGLAATIGATAVAASAQKVESAIRDHQPTEAPLAQFRADLDQQVAAIKAALPPAPPPPAPVAADQLDTAKLQALCQQLLDWTSQDDAQAEQLWSDNRMQFEAYLPNHFSALDRSIQGFDFQAAAELLRNALSQQ